MPRTSRIAFENGFFHVFNRGHAKESLFLDEADYRKFLKKLEELKTVKGFDHSVFAYVLMPNHFHLLIQTRKTPIAKIMSSLSTAYSVYFNFRHKRMGSLFQNRFKSKLCDKDTYFLGASRYLMLNPVEAGIVKNLKDYPWSSYQEIFGTSQFKIIDKKELEKIIGRREKEKEKYRQFILDGLAIVNDLGKQYNFKKQIEGSPKFNTRLQKQFARERIKKKINKFFNIKV